MLKSIATSLLLSTLVGIEDASARTDPLFSDSFESYSVGGWATPWARDGNASDSQSNGVTFDPVSPSNRVLKLYGQVGGCWGALTYAAMTFPPEFVVRARVYNGDETLSGCHQNYAGISLRQGVAWQNPQVFAIAFLGNGTIVKGDGVTVLQPYQSRRWYDIAVRYSRVGATRRLHYWVNNVDLGELVQQIPGLGVETPFDHLDLNVGEGSAYFDNVQVVTTYCPGDYDDSGTVGVQDLFTFLSDYFAGAPRADVSRDSVISVGDIFSYLALYFAGCV